jgi:O-antigen/teichoic acid export membrane protein
MSGIAQKSLENFIARIAGQALTIGGAIVVARTLGPSGKGDFSYAGAVLAMLQMANAGQSAAIAWQYTRKHRAPADLLVSMLRILGAGVVPAGVLMAVLAWQVPGQSSLFAAAAALPFALFIQSSTGFFLADGDVRAINVQQILIAASVAVYVPLLIFVHAGLPVLFAAWAGGYALAAAYTAVKLRAYARAARSRTKGIAREQLLYGGQVSANSLMQYLNFRIDVFLIMFMLGKSALGIYSIGIGIGETLWQLSRPMATASFANVARGTPSQAANTTAACMRHSLALVLAASVVVFIAVPALVPLVYGRQFAAAGTVARILLPGIIAYSMMPILGTYFAQQLGRPKIPLLLSALSTLVCAVVTWLALPRFGIAGGAMATSISYCLAFGAAAIYFVNQTRIAPRRMFALSREDLRPYRSLLRI